MQLGDLEHFQKKTRQKLDQINCAKLKYSDYEQAGGQFVLVEQVLWKKFGRQLWWKFFVERFWLKIFLGNIWQKIFGGKLQWKFLEEMPYLISLNPLLLKNIAHIGSTFCLSFSVCVFLSLSLSFCKSSSISLSLREYRATLNDLKIPASCTDPSEISIP